MIFYGVLAVVAVAAVLVVVPTVLLIGVIARLECMAPAPEFRDDRAGTTPPLLHAAHRRARAVGSG